MHERPARLPFAATLVVRAAAALTLAEKLVWLEDHAFDRGPEGAYVSAASLAARWGGSMAAKTIESARTRLKLMGLHERIARPGARNVFGWFATLPDACVPGTDRPSAEDVARLARKLDEFVRVGGPPATRGTDPPLPGGQTPRYQGDRPPATRGTDPPPAGGRVSGRGEGGRAVPASVVMSESSFPPAVRQDGTAAHAAEAEDGTEGPDLATRRARAAADSADAEEVRREGWQKIRAGLAERRKAAGP